MPNVTPTGSSPPPVSGSVEDPKQLERAGTLTFSRTFPEDDPDPELPEKKVLDRIVVVGLNPIPESQDAGDEKTSGEVERASLRSKKREEVIKRISISSTSFIGPTCRPQPVIEDELSEFYKELAQINQPDTGDGNIENVSQSWAPLDAVKRNGEPVSQFGIPHTGELNSENIVVSGDTVKGNSVNIPRFRAPSDTIHKNSKNISQSWASLNPVDGNTGCISRSWVPSDTLDGNNKPVSRPFLPPNTLDGDYDGVYQPSAPQINPPAIKEIGNPHSNTYRPYPAPWPHAADRNAPQWRPQPFETTYSWSNPHRYNNPWQVPPPNFRFHPPPPPPNLTYPPYPQPHRHQYGQIENSSFRPGPVLRSAPSHSPAPYDSSNGRDYYDQNYQDGHLEEHYDDPSLVLILMRGVPGSGKTTLARQISSGRPSGLILSTDDYFYQKDCYHFEPALLGAAHTWNQNRAKKAMLDGNTPVIIDNTNVQAWEMKPYVEAALEMGYRVEFAEPDTSWKCDPVELEKRNHHGVPKKSLINMLDRFELPISVDIVMNSHEPSHKSNEHHSRHQHSHRR